MKHFFTLFLFLVIAILTPYSIAIAEDSEKVIVVSEKVGEVIDAEERERFALWPEIKGFKSAIFLQLSDGSYVAEVIYEKNGEEKKARTPQSEIAIKLLKSYIEKVSKGEIQPISLTDEEKKPGNYTKGELVSISGKVGASIDKNETNEYALFRNIQDFKRATFYSIKEGGYLIEIQTLTDTLISVILDTKMLSILGDYVDRYEIIRLNRESFEKKWSIVSYDEHGIPITENEMLRYHKKLSCCALGGGLGCGLGGGALGLVTGVLVASISSPDYDIIHSTEKESKRISVFGYTGIAAGAIAGYFIGNSFDNRISKGSIVREIKKSRTPK